MAQSEYLRLERGLRAKRPRSIDLIRLSRSRIEHSSPDSDPHAKQTGFATATATLGLPGRRRDFQRQKVRNPARCHRTIVSGRTIVTASRTVGASRYSNTKIKRSKDVRAGRLGVLRRSTFNWWRSAITSPSSELLDRKRSRRIHLIRLKGSSTRRSSPNSGAQTKWMGFAIGTA